MVLMHCIIQECRRLGCQTCPGVKEVWSHSPEKRPTAARFLFETDDAAVSKADGAAVRFSGKQHRRQAREMRKVADNQNVVVVYLQKIRCEHWIAVGIEFARVARPGGASDDVDKKMCGFFCARLAAVLISDTEIRSAARNSAHLSSLSPDSARPQILLFHVEPDMRA